ncbi:DUF4350 domain-containing protein [Thermosphaera sp.]
MKRKPKPILAYSVFLGLVTAISIIAVLPVNLDYYVLDRGDYGYSALYSESGIVLYSLKELGERGPDTALLVLGRGRPLNTRELDYVISFTRKGGVVIVFGPPDAIIQLLKNLGLDAELEGYVYDPVFNAGDPCIVVARDTRLNTTLLVDRPFALRFSSNPASTIHPTMFTSDFSFIDEYGDGYYTVGEYLGEVPVGFEIEAGKGRVVIVLAHGVLTNRVLQYNKDWFSTLNTGRDILIDQSWVRSNPVFYLKTVIHGQQGVSPFYLAFITLIATVAIIYVAKTVHAE